ncbi:MAG: hypothetical protein WCC64_04380 [Aliidongia sp.]
MKRQSGLVRVLGFLLGGMLTVGVPALAADDVSPAAIVASTSPDPAALNLRDAVGLVAQHFDFAVIGANRLGTEAPSWPAEDRGPEAMLDTLLKGYSYIVLLKPEASPGAARQPKTLLITGLFHPQPETATPTPAVLRPNNRVVAANPPTLAAPVKADEVVQRSRPPAWAQRPSTVVRALTQLATTNGGNPAAAQATPAAAPTDNPAQNTDAMAALTRSAQSGLGALVIGLRQACPTPNSC